MTAYSVTAITEGVTFPGGEQLDWKNIEKISQSEGNCYTVVGQGIQAIQVFSTETNRLCSLMPTRGAPSMLIAVFVMHRIKELDPWQHAQRMIASLPPASGSVLDTATGLGYTSLLPARTPDSLTTISLHTGAKGLAQLN